jgi:hypothetical protein
MRSLLVAFLTLLAIACVPPASSRDYTAPIADNREQVQPAIVNQAPQQQAAQLCAEELPREHPSPGRRAGETEVAEQWTASSRTYTDGRSKRLVASVGTINYEDGGRWHEPAPTVVPSDDPAYECMVAFAPYRAYFSASGARKVYPDRNDPDAWIEVPAARFSGGRTFTKTTDTGYKHVSSTHEVQLRFDSWQIVYDVVFFDAPETNTLLFEYTPNGMTDEEVLALFGGNVQVDAGGNEKLVQTAVADGLITVTFDRDVAYPLLVDPTITPQVDETGCDGWEDESAGNAFITGTHAFANEADQVIGLCFTVTGPSSGDTIDSSFLTMYIRSGIDDEPLHILCAEDVDDAAVFQEVVGDFAGRLASCTTATDTWDETDLGASTDQAYEWGAAAGDPTNGADIGPMVQEVVNRGGWASGNRLALLIDATDNGRDLAIATFDDTPTHPAVLEVTYTAGGAPTPTPAPRPRAVWQWCEC